jgi:cytochrome c biogenesis protein CcdA
MLRKIFIFLAFAGLLITLFSGKVSASGFDTTVAVFFRNGCAHCKAEEKFISNLTKTRHDFRVKRYSLENLQDRKIWEEFTTRIKSGKVTPVTVIGNKYIVGFDSDETTGKEIITLINSAAKYNIQTDLEKVKDGKILDSSCDESGLKPCTVKPAYYVSLPLIGRTDTQKYPLLILSALLGFFDGFNPCAMWVLITFLLILLQVGNRRKMYIFAGTFILAEAIMYSLILVVWYKTWDFVRLDAIVTPVIGIVSIFGGILFLKEWRKKELECKITDLKQRKKLRDRISFLATNKFTLLTFISILGIAFSVNIIEFACSIGIPQAFTKILEINKLNVMENGFYLLIYIFFYMIDDLVVFAIALYGADKLTLTTKYSKLSNLIGGVIMIILGLILIFKPSAILF